MKVRFSVSVRSTVITEDFEITKLLACSENELNRMIEEDELDDFLRDEWQKWRAMNSDGGFAVLEANNATP